MNKRLDEISARLRAATTVDKLKPLADAYAQEWIVHAHEKLIADMKTPDDVACGFETAFADGYMTGVTHSSAEKDLTLLLEIVRAQDVENANLRAALAYAKKLLLAPGEVIYSSRDVAAEIEKLERGGV